MSAAVLQQLRARSVSVHKAMATRNPPSAILPPLDGWPAAAVPGCLLMALVSAATGKDWNGAAGAEVQAGTWVTAVCVRVGSRQIVWMWEQKQLAALPCNAGRGSCVSCYVSCRFATQAQHCCAMNTPGGCAACLTLTCSACLTVFAGSKLEGGKVPKDDLYHKFAAATHVLGFRGLLGMHR